MITEAKYNEILAKFKALFVVREFSLHGCVFTVDFSRQRISNEFRFHYAFTVNLKTGTKLAELVKNNTAWEPALKPTTEFQKVINKWLEDVKAVFAGHTPEVAIAAIAHYTYGQYATLQGQVDADIAQKINFLTARGMVV